MTSSWGGTRYPPFAFTEHGVAMLSSILNSEKAVEINIAIIRAFIAMRHFSASYAALAQKVHEIEAKMGKEFGTVNKSGKTELDPKN